VALNVQMSIIGAGFGMSAFVGIGTSAAIAQVQPPNPTTKAVINLSDDGRNEVAHWGSSATQEAGTSIDVLGGARYWWMEGKLSASATAVLTIGDLTLSGSRAIAKSPSVDWVDPLVGLRLRHQFVPGLNLTVSGDVGGFDVGSRLSWQALAALNYDFYKSKSVVWSGMAGYRALYVDYSKGSGPTLFEYDMTLHGPILGVTARF
jgi:hypothetical protein